MKMTSFFSSSHKQNTKLPSCFSAAVRGCRFVWVSKYYSLHRLESLHHLESLSLPDMYGSHMHAFRVDANASCWERPQFVKCYPLQCQPTSLTQIKRYSRRFTQSFSNFDCLPADAAFQTVLHFSQEKIKL